MFDGQIRPGAYDQRDSTEQIAFNREVKECVVESEKWNAALRLTPDDGQEADASVGSAGSSRTSTEDRASELETDDLCDLLVDRDVHLRRRQSVGICRGCSDEHCFRSRIHRVVLNGETELTKYLADSLEQQHIDELRRAPAIGVRQVSGGIGEKRLQMIVVNDRANVLDLEVLGVRRKVLELDQVQEI